MKNQLSMHSNILRRTGIIILVVLIMVSYATNTICWPQLDSLELETSKIAQNNQQWIGKNIDNQHCPNLNHHSESHTTFNCDSSFELAFKLIKKSERSGSISIITTGAFINYSKVNVFQTLNKAPFWFYHTNIKSDLSLYSQKTSLLFYD